MTLPEALAALTIMALGTGVAVPSMSTMLKSWKLTAAARDMAVEMQRARAEAIEKGDYVGILYERNAPGDRWRLYQDGGTRGIHAAEIASGIDTPLGATFDLAARYPGVRFGIADGGPVPRIPPASGTMISSDHPIAFGSSDIYSASPTGETSSGSLDITDGGDMRAVVVFGATGRIRVWSFERSTGRWRQ